MIFYEVLSSLLTYLIPLRSGLDNFVWFLSQPHHLSLLNPGLPCVQLYNTAARVYRLSTYKSKRRSIRRVNGFKLEKVASQGKQRMVFVPFAKCLKNVVQSVKH